VISELIKHTGEFMIPRFKEIVRAIMNFKDHKAKIIRIAIISLLPLLGSYCPDAFSKSYINESVDFLIRCSKVPGMLRCIGLLGLC
jgi:serine/threonine-protein kinase mTOR